MKIAVLFLSKLHYQLVLFQKHILSQYRHEPAFLLIVPGLELKQLIKLSEQMCSLVAVLPLLPLAD